MVRERRLYPRNSVNWEGHATFNDGPQHLMRVLDVRAGGARLLLPSDASPRRQELLEMTAFRRSAWPFRQGKSVNALGRVVRVHGIGQDGCVEVGIRFHTPLRESRRLTGMLRFPVEWSLKPTVSPCA